MMLKCNLLYCMVLKFGALITLLLCREATFICHEKTLRVGMRTPNELINGELGKFPIYTNAQIR